MLDDDQMRALAETVEAGLRFRMEEVDRLGMVSCTAQAWELVLECALETRPTGTTANTPTMLDLHDEGHVPSLAEMHASMPRMVALLSSRIPGLEWESGCPSEDVSRSYTFRVPAVSLSAGWPVAEPAHVTPPSALEAMAAAVTNAAVRTRENAEARAQAERTTLLDALERAVPHLPYPQGKDIRTLLKSYGRET